MIADKVRLKDLVKISKGKKCEESNSKKLRYIQIGDLRNDDKLKYAAPNNKNVECLESDILIAWDGANAGTIGYNLKGVIGSTIAKLSPKKKFNTPYVAKFLQSKFRYLRANCTGATIPHISRPVLEGLKIPLPPLLIQKQIAEILDTADTLRRETAAQLADLDALAQSVFLEMFGDPVLNPKGWEKSRLEDILKFMTSGSRGWAKYYSDSGDIFLRINNVGKNNLKLDSIKFVNTPNTAEAKRTKVETGDVLISITADLGRTAVIPENFPKAHINQHLGLLRLNNECNPYYVSEYITSKGGEVQLMKSDKGGVKAGLNFADIKSIKIPLPPIELQNRFAEILANIESQKSELKQSQQESEDLFNGLLQEVFG